jgi:LmbE family N-acetylglucosaminyl deacetylase
LRPLLERQQPQLIYLPHACDGHPDHRACRPIVQAALSSSLFLRLRCWAMRSGRRFPNTIVRRTSAR